MREKLITSSCRKLKTREFVFTGGCKQRAKLFSGGSSEFFGIINCAIVQAEK